jgi:transcriptional regulator with XRE-family HTH domain
MTKVIIVKSIGEYIREKRKELKLTTLELAKYSGVSQGHITLIENGKRVPSFPIMVKLVQTPQVNRESFLYDTGYPETNIEPACRGFRQRVPLLSWVKAGD